jgi:hypothetical protein
MQPSSGPLAPACGGAGVVGQDAHGHTHEYAILVVAYRQPSTRPSVSPLQRTHGKGVDMIGGPFDKPLSSQPSPAAWQDSSEARLHDGKSQGRAVATLLKHGVLSETFGENGEYEVRTTLTTHRAWQYRCRVFCEGKAIKGAFVPIIVDRTPHKPHVRQAPGVTEAMRLKFAREAVDVHCTRCAAVQEHLLLAVLYSQPLPKNRRRYALLILLLGAVFLTTYGLWKPALWIDSGQLPESPSPLVQEAQHPGVDRHSTEPPLSVPQPTFSDEASGDIPVPESPPERAEPAPRAPTPEAPQEPPESTASDVNAGDPMHLTGWIHRIFRDSDNSYRLQMSQSRETEAPNLIAVVPHPDRASKLPAVRAQLQTVRAFITQRLLRGQEPSPRGSVMRRPVFVQLTGQPSNPDRLLANPPQGKGPRDARARREMSPVLEIQFATPGSSDR